MDILIQSFRIPFLRNILLLAFVVAVAFPLYEIWISYPRFNLLLTQFVEIEGQRITQHLGRRLQTIEHSLDRTNLPQDFTEEMSILATDFHLFKIKLFSADGETIYSSDPENIGKKNANDYFQHRVAKGEILSKVVKKEHKTLDGSLSRVSVVETYLPIMKGGEFIGAFEIYYDITTQRKQLIDLFRQSLVILVLGSIALLVGIITVVFRAASALQTQELIRKELTKSEERFRQMAGSAQDGIIEIDEADRVIFWNKAAERIFGYSASDMLGKALHASVVPERFCHAFEQKFAHFQQCGTGSMLGRTSEVVGLHRDGTEFPVEISLSGVSYQQGYHAVAILRDITERKKIEQQLKLGSEVILHAAQGIMVTNPSGIITMVNPAFTKLTGYMPEEVIGKTPSILRSGRHDHLFYQDLWNQLKTTGEWQGEIWNRRKNGETYPEWLIISSILDHERKIIYHIGMFIDITQRKEIEQGLERLAFYDPLTGVANRMLFHERLHYAFHESKRYNNEKIVLFYLDLDWFKQVNDTYGHEIGDMLLQSAATRLNDVVRTVDTVARLGGDEFAIIFKYIPGCDTAEMLANKIIQTLTAPFQLKEHECKIGTSIGIAIYPDHAATAEELVASADAAMYNAKRGGRNRYCLAST